MIVSTVRDPKPPAPAFDRLTVVLSHEEGRKLCALLACVAGYSSGAPDDGLRLVSKADRVGGHAHDNYYGYSAKEIRDGMQSPLVSQLNTHYKLY